MSHLNQVTMSFLPVMQAKAVETARVYGLDPALVCAVVEQESGWDPWAMRYEPAFYERYIQPKVLRCEIRVPAEAHGRAISWGLMQVMGQTARENGFGGKFFSELCDPATGLDVGCRILRKYVEASHLGGNTTDPPSGDVRPALLRWNGGGNPEYADQVIARLPKYRNA